MTATGAGGDVRSRRGAGRLAAARSFAVADGRALGRDPMLRLLAVAPLAMVGVVALGLPLVERWLDGSVGVDVTAARPALAAFLAAVTVPLFSGTMAGLLVLEDRECGVLPALAVSPAGLSAYLAVRLGWAGGAGGTIAALALALHGGYGAGVLIAVGLLTGGAAAVVALLVGGLAGDRLEGLAVTKAATLPLALPVLVWALGVPLGWLAAPLPTASAVYVLHAADTGAAPPVLLVAAGAAQLAVLGRLAWRRLVRRTT
ncbi:hypothetical protein [Egicoccus halophilus]|uniref:Fluoroquinolone transport system permease protein n=1 Tax=Egicoccus halophilus TaxID=1670830 RepID=A0A8J3ER55_9ACTN|nr:hypothetical protein [Egicoccus halophilus]GGI04209.1 hypothetical protein GCM10011354_07960 [Egicoccus halophilus]